MKLAREGYLTTASASALAVPSVGIGLWLDELWSGLLVAMAASLKLCVRTDTSTPLNGTLPIGVRAGGRDPRVGSIPARRVAKASAAVEGAA